MTSLFPFYLLFSPHSWIKTIYKSHSRLDLVIKHPRPSSFSQNEKDIRLFPSISLMSRTYLHHSAVGVQLMNLLQKPHASMNLAPFHVRESFTARPGSL